MRFPNFDISSVSLFDWPLLLGLPPWTGRFVQSSCPTGRCVRSRCHWPRTRCSARRSSPPSLWGRSDDGRGSWQKNNVQLRDTCLWNSTTSDYIGFLARCDEHLWRCCGVPCISCGSRPRRCGWRQTGRCPHRCNWPGALDREKDQTVISFIYSNVINAGWWIWK